ncbi:FliH/SctL family protein [Agilicoccus flavus]|uniref:FliH/SctL family protein n=1 Tax=Agilicoccus flavus TaxID=2775968 RepID=UPI001CF6446F|nr:FliH/SctL family protein [Agilicoccus flavus]
MSSLPDPVRPAFVIRRGEDHGARPARLSTDLARAGFAGVGVADARRVDPYLDEVIAAAREQAHRDGYVAGHADGMEVGVREGRALLAEQQAALLDEDARERAARRERLSQLLGAVEEAVVGALDYQAPRVEELRDLIAGLAVDIAEAVVGHHLSVGECAAQDALRRALEQVPRRTSLEVRMHPADVALVTDITGEITEWHIARLVPDLSVERGDAVAVAENLEVEASVAGAFERVRAVLHP